MANKHTVLLENIGKRFGDVIANDGINLEIRGGEILSLLGENGSGKTTLMNIIGVLDRPTEGEYRLDGLDIAALKDQELSRIRNQKIGFVFQTYNLISRTSALKNVELPMMYAGIGRKERAQRARYYLEMGGMEERMSHKPDELSGGQKQRVAIARAMATAMPSSPPRVVPFARTQPSSTSRSRPSPAMSLVQPGSFSHTISRWP